MAVRTASPSPSRRTDAALQNLAGDFPNTFRVSGDSGLSKSERSSDCQASKLETVSASQIPNNSAQFCPGLQPSFRKTGLVSTEWVIV